MPWGKSQILVMNNRTAGVAQREQRRKAQNLRDAEKTADYSASQPAKRSQAPGTTPVPEKQRDFSGTGSLLDADSPVYSGVWTVMSVSLTADCCYSSSTVSIKALKRLRTSSANSLSPKWSEISAMYDMQL